MPRSVIIQCDDFGIAPNVSSGILRVLGANAATSTSVMANLVTDKELRELHEITDRVGVHLTLTLGRPLTAAAPLVTSSGEFDDLKAVFKALVTARLPLPAIEREWHAQIARVQSSGLTVTSLDGHQHVHWFGPLAEVAARLARTFGIERIRAPYRVIGRRFELRTLARSWLARAAVRHLTEHGARSPGTLVDLEVIEHHKRPLELLARRLRGVIGDLEVCAHPSRAAVDDVQIFGHYDRVRQLDWLLSGSLIETLKDAGFTLERE